MNTFKLPTVLAGALWSPASSASAPAASQTGRRVTASSTRTSTSARTSSSKAPTRTAQRPGNDPGWLVRATVTETSIAEPARQSAIGVFTGRRGRRQPGPVPHHAGQAADAGPCPVLGAHEPGPHDGGRGTGPSNDTGVTDDIVNAWPVTNVDLKYRVNLDGEKTNFYEENQELDWQVRQWVKLQFDKNDFSDLAPLNFQTLDMINSCATVPTRRPRWSRTASTSRAIEDNDPSNDYFEFTVQVTLPLISTTPPASRPTGRCWPTRCASAGPT